MKHFHSLLTTILCSIYYQKMKLSLQLRCGGLSWDTIHQNTFLLFSLKTLKEQLFITKTTSLLRTKNQSVTNTHYNALTKALFISERHNLFHFVSFYIIKCFILFQFLGRSRLCHHFLNLHVFRTLEYHRNSGIGFLSSGRTHHHQLSWTEWNTFGTCTNSSGWCDLEGSISKQINWPLFITLQSLQWIFLSNDSWDWIHWLCCSDYPEWDWCYQIDSTSKKSDQVVTTTKQTFTKGKVAIL